ncbi:MAG: type II secretion system F family protein [Candidatus Babeliales bacterium]
MALFAYQAFTKEGKKVKGTIDAASLDAAKAALLQQGYYLTAIDAAKEGAGSWSLTMLLSRSVSTKDKILFTKQLSVLLRSGVPLLQALTLLTEQFTGIMSTIIIALRDGIKEGKSLAQGLAAYPKTFDTIYVQLVRAGEATGKLDVVLDRLVSYMERREELRAKVRGAMRQPLIQLGMVTLITIGLLTFVLPNLMSALPSNAQLPWTTAILMGLSHIIINYWYILLAVLLVIILVFRYWRSTESGAYAWDSLKLKLPIVGFFARMGAVVQFSRTLSILLESGVNITQALDIVVNIIDNRVLVRALMEARDKIIKQGRIAEFLEQTHMFPKIATYLMSTGEQSGQLDAMLLTVAQNYEKEVDEYADNLASLLDPIMMVVVGAIVGFVVFSIIQPILSMTQAMSM